MTRVLWGVGGALLLGGCASVGSGGGVPFRGTSGPVAWEVVDIGQLVRSDGQRIRWSYTIVLKETTGSRIQFETAERNSSTGRGDLIGGRTTPQPFRRTLEARSELRLPMQDGWGWVAYQPQLGGASSLPSLVVDRRFIGSDAQGRSVSVTIRVQLDRSVGKVAKPAPVSAPLPLARNLRAGELATLAGAWRGAYRADVDDGFDIPVEVTLREDGSFEAAENDPPTDRFRGTVRIQDGQVSYSAGRDTGMLTLHEGQGKRVLFGNVSGPRGGQGGAAPSTFTYAVRLESVARTP